MGSGNGNSFDQNQIWENHSDLFYSTTSMETHDFRFRLAYAYPALLWGRGV